MATNLRLCPDTEATLRAEAQRSGRSEQEIRDEALDLYLWYLHVAAQPADSSTPINCADSMAAIDWANRLRLLLATLYGGTPAGFVFISGLGTGGLWPLFWRLHIDHVILTDQEYYGKHSFPYVSDVSVIGRSANGLWLDAVLDAVRQKRRSTAALIMSVVSCQGEPLPVASTFTRLRRHLGADCPLLIADYSHAGAIDFPPITELNADVVGGDPAKWVLSGADEANSPVRFLYFHSPRIRDLVKPDFESVLLATDEPAVDKGWLSTGVMVREVRRLVIELDHQSHERADHRRVGRMSNQDLAVKLAEKLALPAPRSALLLLDSSAQRALADLVGSARMVALRADGLLRDDPIHHRLRLLCRVDRFDALGIPVKALGLSGHNRGAGTPPHSRCPGNGDQH